MKFKISREKANFRYTLIVSAKLGVVVGIVLFAIGGYCLIGEHPILESDALYGIGAVLTIVFAEFYLVVESVFQMMDLRKAADKKFIKLIRLLAYCLCALLLLVLIVWVVLFLLSE